MSNGLPPRAFGWQRAFLLSATMLSGWTVPALAQDQGTTVGLQDIVVTARRVEERLQDVPLAVTALTSETIQDRQITQAVDLVGVVPNLNTTRTSTPGGTQFNIRGQASGALPNISLDQRIGIYLDGIYIARSQGGSFTLADIERVEVLRGPQGTQFGKNLTGGAINFITAVPTGELGGIVEATVGNLGRARVRATINTPDMGGLSMRFSYVHDQQNGFVDNLTPGRSFGNITNAATGFDFAPNPSVKRFHGFNNETFFAALRYQGIEGLTVDLKGDYAINDEYPNGLQTLGYGGNFVGCGAAALGYGVAFDCSQGAAFQPDAFIPGILARNGSVNYGVGLGPGGTNLPPTSAAANIVRPGFTKQEALAQPLSGRSPIRNRGVSLTLNYDVNDDLTLRSITGYRKVNTRVNLSLDGGAYYVNNDVANLFGAGLPAGGVTPYCISCAFQFQRQNQISEELQLIGKLGSSIDFLAGLYYFREKGYSFNTFVANYNPYTTFFPAAFRNGIPPLQTDVDNEVSNSAFANGDDTRIRSISRAVFGRVTIRPVEQIDIVLGGRYTQDRKTNIVSPTLAALVDEDGDITNGLQNPPTTRKVAFNKFTYDGTVTYHVTPDINVFARYATAYLAGGMLRNVVYLPETTKSIEAGIKSEFWNRRVRLNVTGFYQKSRNLQIPTNRPPFGALVVDNVGTSKVKGFEAELTTVPVEGLTLGANVGFTHADYSDNSRNTQPRWSLQLNGAYDLYTFANGVKVTVAADGVYRSRYWNARQPINSAAGGLDGTPLPPIVYQSQGFATQAEYLDALNEAMGLGRYWLVNGRVSVSELPMGSIKGRVSAWVRNIFDEDHVMFAGDYGTQVGSFFEQDRTFGVDLRLEF